MLLTLQLKFFPPRPLSTLCIRRYKFSYNTLGLLSTFQYTSKRLKKKKKKLCYSLKTSLFIYGVYLDAIYFAETENLLLKVL